MNANLKKYIAVASKALRRVALKTTLLNTLNVLVAVSFLAVSNASAASGGGTPNAPSNLRATAVSSSQINLTWTDNASNETGYYVERSIGSGTSYSVIATLSANATAYSNSSLSPSTTYNYRVRASNASAPSSQQYSGYSSVASATAPATSSYTIATSSSPTAGGSTSGAGIKTSGTVATVSALANSGYSFVKWTENGVQVSTSATYSFTVTGNRSLVANFSASTAYYTITMSSSPSAGGTTSGGGTKTSGTVTTVSALANSGYSFVNWTENGAQVSTSATYSFTVTGNRSLVANFSATTGGYAITTSSSPSAGGSTSGGGTKTSGSIATVTATANSGYTFANWRENGTVVSTSATYSFTVTGNRSLVANFSASTAYYTITMSSSPSAGGTTSGGGTKTSGTVTTVSALANSGYSFVNWTENGAQVSTSATYSFTVTGNRSLVANFSATTGGYAITTSSSPSAGGSTSGGGTKTSGTVATVSALANSGYSFVNWTENGAQVSTSATYSFTVTGNRGLVANFSATTSSYTITTSSSPSAGGSTSGGGTKTSGTTVTVLATPNGGYSFVNWTQGGVVVSTSASYSFTANANRTLVANFTTATAYTITTSSSPTAGGTTSGGGTKASGSSATVVATANSGYSFVNWTENGATVSTSASYAFSVIGNRNLVANFTSTITGGGSWAKVMGGSGVDTGNAVGTDAAGNVFVAGYFEGTANFSGVTLSSAGSDDIVVAKYSPTGSLLWVKRFGGSSDDQALALAVDRSSGDVVVTGYFSGTATFGSVTYSSIGGRDIFLAKISGSSGTVLWSKQIGGQWGVDGEDIGYGVAIDPRNGDVVLTGQISGWIDVGFGWVITTSSSSDTLLTRLSSGGTYQWAKTFVANGVDRGMAVAVDAGGNILLAGNVSGTIDLGGGTLMLGGWLPDVYVAKLTSAGGHIWSKGFGNDYYTGISGLAVDASGNVAITGYFSQTINFGTGNLTAINTSGYALKLAASNGATLWSRAFVGSANASGNAVVFDASGNLVVTGSYYVNCDFGGGVFSAPTSIHEGFVAKYTAASGGHLWSKRFGGTGDDRGFAVSVDAAGNTILTGTSGGGDFNGTTLSTAGGNDLLLMKLAP